MKNANDLNDLAQLADDLRAKVFEIRESSDEELKQAQALLSEVRDLLNKAAYLAAPTGMDYVRLGSLSEGANKLFVALLADATHREGGHPVFGGSPKAKVYLTELEKAGLLNVVLDHGGFTKEGQKLGALLGYKVSSF